MIIHIPMSLFPNTRGRSKKAIAHDQFKSRNKMKGIGSIIVSFIAIFLMISLEMMGGAEGKPQPQPQPEPQPGPQPCKFGTWCDHIG